MDVLVVEGTVREGRKSIHAARFAVEQLKEKGHNPTLYDLKERDVPMMATRTYADPSEPPEDVQEFAEQVKAADVILLVVPEYNHSLPGSLKNLLDYLYPEYEGKLFAYITVSGGGFGGVRAQTHLNEITIALGGAPGPSLAISRIGTVFDEDGELLDKDYVSRYGSFIEKIEKKV